MHKHTIIFILAFFLVYSGIAIIMAAYRRKIEKPKNAPKIVASISILMIYYNVFGMVLSNIRTNLLVISVGLLLLSISLSLLSLLKIVNIKRQMRLLFYSYYTIATSFYILGGLIAVVFVSLNYGNLNGLLLAEILTLIGLLISPLSYLKIVLNILGYTLILYIISSYHDFACYILLSILIISFISINFLKEFIILEVLAIFSGISMYMLTYFMPFSKIQLLIF